jgi:hypothetical protein
LSWVGGFVVAAVLPPLDEPSQSPGLIRFGHKPVLMLRFKAVQEELKLTPEQVQKHQKLLTGMRDQMLTLIENGERKKARSVVDEQEKGLRDILTPGQRKRLQQVYLQVQGLWAMTEADTAKALQLTPEQVKNLRELQAAIEKEIEKSVGQAGTRSAVQKKLAEHHAAANDKGLLLLTAAQRDKWKEMTGEPFKGEIPRIAPKGKAGSRPDK